MPMGELLLTRDLIHHALLQLFTPQLSTTCLSKNASLRKSPTQARPFLPIPFRAKDLPQNYVPFVETTDARDESYWQGLAHEVKSCCVIAAFSGVLDDLPGSRTILPNPFRVSNRRALL